MQFHQYDEAAHGFFYYHTPIYRSEAAMGGWARVFAFLSRHLSG
jgi:carboxymethylenebutenolidase